MNRLIEHICFLLLENDFVVVPELGGFVVNKEHACCDYSKQMIVVPRCWVSFNNALTHNDGLLVQLYTKTQSISYVEAENVIKEDVRQLKLHLSSTEKTILGNWGCLSRNEDGIICFQNLSGNILRPHLLGFENLTIYTLDELQAKDENKQQKKTKFIGKTIALISAGAAAAILLFSVSIPISEQNGNNAQYAGFFSEKILTVDASKAVNPLKEKKVDLLSQKEKDRGTTQDNSTKAEVSPGRDSYFLIVSTFKSMPVASNVLKDIQKKGIRTCGIIESARTKKIYVASFRNEQEAKTYLSKFMGENSANKEAWIYSIRPTDKIRTTVE